MDIKLSWDDWYNLAKKYYRYHGNLLISIKFKTKNGYEYDKDGYALGSWISRQRIAYSNIELEKDKKKQQIAPLTENKIELLESIGMVFNVYEYLWNKMYNLAKKYYEYYGNLSVSRGFKTKNGYEYDEEGYALGNWLKHQHIAYSNIDLEKDKRKQQIAPLTENKIELLESIGVVFTPRRDIQRSIELCELFNIDYKKHSYLVSRISYKELNAKINYLIDNNYPVLETEKPNDMLFMSDINMQAIYGISKEELINNYYKPKKKRRK